MYHIQSHLLGQDDSELSERSPYLASEMQSRILSDENWMNQREHGFDQRHHTNFMKPFCRQIKMGNAPVTQSILELRAGDRFDGIRRTAGDFQRELIFVLGSTTWKSGFTDVLIA